MQDERSQGLGLVTNNWGRSDPGDKGMEQSTGYHGCLRGVLSFGVWRGGVCPEAFLRFVECHLCSQRCSGVVPRSPGCQDVLGGPTVFWVVPGVQSTLGNLSPHLQPSILEGWGCLKSLHGHHIQILPAGKGLYRGMRGRRRWGHRRIQEQWVLVGARGMRG
uniref:Uncharacterized protein n=1 Tax=Calidris pygmaea TaxID=425635 RepID=A0A8C3JUE5_9CHAR